MLRDGAFVLQMFSGVASARVKELFEDARKAAPAIIFIDEIDAIGRSRDDQGLTDTNAQEREQGLMQMLVQMDGFHKTEQASNSGCIVLVMPSHK
jgi:ATP-dependent Zn protease